MPVLARANVPGLLCCCRLALHSQCDHGQRNIPRLQGRAAASLLLRSLLLSNSYQAFSSCLHITHYACVMFQDNFVFSYFLPKERRTHGVFVEFGVCGRRQCVNAVVPRWSLTATHACVCRPVTGYSRVTVTFSRSICVGLAYASSRGRSTNKQNWQGGAIPALTHSLTHSLSPAAYKQLVKNRPKCHNVNGAICKTNGPRAFIGAV